MMRYEPTKEVMETLIELATLKAYVNVRCGQCHRTNLFKIKVKDLSIDLTGKRIHLGLTRVRRVLQRDLREEKMSTVDLRLLDHILSQHFGDTNKVILSLCSSSNLILECGTCVGSQGPTNFSPNRAGHKATRKDCP